MDTAVVLIVVAVVILAAGAAAYMIQKRRSAQLQERFGPEYERTLEQSGDKRATERDLAARQKRVAKLDIHPITGADARQYRDRWNALQGRFVDEPSGAVDEADALVVQMMREAGYPVDDFDQRVDDISVDHPQVAQHYREAHDIAVANTAGTADTEQLRQAVTAYRKLVDVLLDEDTDSADADARTDVHDAHDRLDADQGSDGRFDADRNDLSSDGRFDADRNDLSTADRDYATDGRFDADRNDLRADDTDGRLDRDRTDLDRTDLDGDHDGSPGRGDIRTAADSTDYQPDERADELADRRRIANTDRTEQS